MHNEGIPAAEVLFTEETSRLEQVKANGLIVELEHSLAGKYRTVGPVLKMSETPLQAKLPAPALGEHTDEILLSLEIFILLIILKNIFVKLAYCIILVLELFFFYSY